MTSTDIIAAAPLLWFSSLVMGLLCRTILDGGRWLVSLVNKR